MKKKIFIVISLVMILLSTGCGKSKPVAPTVPVSEDTISSHKKNEAFTFADYSKKINPLSFPLYIECDNNLQEARTGMPEDQVRKYAPADARIYGKLTETPAYTAILYLYPADIILPVIVTADPQGKKIDELPLFEKYCGEDEFSWGNSRAEIDKNLQVQLVDSVTLFKRNKKGEIIKSTQKTEVRTRSYVVNEQGRILEIE